MKVGGEVMPDTLSKYWHRTFVLSESCVFTTAHKIKPPWICCITMSSRWVRFLASAMTHSPWSAARKKKLNELPKPAAGTVL